MKLAASLGFALSICLACSQPEVAQSHESATVQPKPLQMNWEQAKAPIREGKLHSVMSFGSEVSLSFDGVTFYLLIGGPENLTAYIEQHAPNSKSIHNICAYPSPGVTVSKCLAVCHLPALRFAY